MPKVTVDFSEVQEIEPLEKGEYPAIIEKVTYVEAVQDDKYDYLNAEFTLTDAPGASNKAWIIWSLSPRALFRMKQDFENLGLPADEIEIDYDEDTMLVTEPELAGMPCIVVCDKPRTYEGRLQSNPVAVLASENGTTKGGTKKTATRKTATTAKKTGSTRKFK
jgi:hypothetical protein